MIDAGRISPWHLNELASALGTLALLEGNSSRARKLFLAALQSPSENTVAQVQWALRKASLFPLPDESLKVPRAYEARAWESYFAGRWDDALEASMDWLNDEPFSERPAVMATFVASVPIEDYSRAVMIAEEGLNANPESQLLRNNLVFALASAGRIEEALREARWVRPLEFEDESSSVTWTATRGLVAFRQGKFEEGRRLYLEAIWRSERDGLRRAYAAAFLAREELIARTGQEAPALAFARKAAQGIDSVALRSLMARLEQRMLGSHASDPRGEP